MGILVRHKTALPGAVTDVTYQGWFNEKLARSVLSKKKSTSETPQKAQPANLVLSIW